MVTTEAITAMLKSTGAQKTDWAVGNDMVLLTTFRTSCTPQFIRRVYTPGELAYCTQFSDPVLRYASTWAAKEAVYKALKQIDEHLRIGWRHIEICRDKPSGRPTLLLPAMSFPVEYSLTISHDGDMVWAIAVIVA